MLLAVASQGVRLSYCVSLCLGALSETMKHLTLFEGNDW